MSVAALVSAAAMAWTLATAWIGFRDSVFDGIHALDRRLTVAVESFASHSASSADQINRFNVSVERRIERIEQRVDELKSRDE